MIKDVKEQRDKTHTLDIFLVSDGNEIQNRKLLKKELNELIKSNKMIPHLKEYEILNETLK